MRNEARLTVFFEDPFWVGVYERFEGDELQAAKMVFGAEPKDYEVYEFLGRNFSRLDFSPPVEAERSALKKPNPKRIQRQINQQLSRQGVGTKAQQAMKLQQEEAKQERRVVARKNHQEEEESKYLLKQQKKKEKHRGR